MTTNTNSGVRTPATASASMKIHTPVIQEPLQPYLCIQRDDNTVSPLIAIDELPDSIVLKGVPIKLTILDALKAQMRLISGEYPVHGLHYQLDHPIHSQAGTSEHGDDSGSDGSPTSEGSESSTKKGFTASDKKGNKNAKGKAHKQSTLTANDTSIIDPLAKKGTIGKKVYCTYWIQTGNCNYMQEGCKYKHEIPKDEETRRAIGFREFPNWPREELPARPTPALNKSWRRPDGKPEHQHPSASGPSNRATASPAVGHGTPNMSARGKTQPTAGPSVPGTTQHNPNTPAFTTPHQHFPAYANQTTQQRPFSLAGSSFLGNGAAENYQQRPLQNNGSPPYSQPTSPMMNRGRSSSSTPPKQPPISRPTSLGQSSVTQQQKQSGASTHRVAPDHHLVNRAGGFLGARGPSPSGNVIYGNVRPGYSGMHNNWNPQTNAPTSMDISFIAPASESTRSGSQAVYTPNYTPNSASVTPTVNPSLTFGTMKSDAHTASPANHNANAFASNNNNANIIPIKGRGPIQFGRNSPTPSVGSARNNNNNLHAASTTTAEESDATSATSPPVQHRVFFREPGQPEFVSNPPEPKSGKRKHGKKVHNAVKSAKNKMSGNGYDVLVDVDEQQ